VYQAESDPVLNAELKAAPEVTGGMADPNNQPAYNPEANVYDADAKVPDIYSYTGNDDNKDF
jgi:hypothetical protein